MSRERSAAAPRGPRSGRRAGGLAAALSAVGHLTALALFWLQAGQSPAPPMAPAPEPLTVTLVEVRHPSAEAKAPGGAAGPASPARPAPAKALPHRTVRPPPPDVEPLPVSEAAAAEPLAALSEAQLAGAMTADSGAAGGGGSGWGSGSGAGSGPSGRACDMVRRLQSALRRDPEVQAAVAEAHRAAGSASSAVLVWNGDWIRSPSQAGKGLAGVRQAISMEVAFAPEACRAEPMRGLVLISMNDTAGAPRLVLGSGEWRWSDLLLPRAGGAVSRR